MTMIGLDLLGLTRPNWGAAGDSGGGSGGSRGVKSRHRRRGGGAEQGSIDAPLAPGVDSAYGKLTGQRQKRNTGLTTSTNPLDSEFKPTPLPKTDSGSTIADGVMRSRRTFSGNPLDNLKPAPTVPDPAPASPGGGPPTPPPATDALPVDPSAPWQYGPPEGGGSGGGGGSSAPQEFEIELPEGYDAEPQESAVDDGPDYDPEAGALAEAEDQGEALNGLDVMGADHTVGAGILDMIPGMSMFTGPSGGAGGGQQAQPDQRLARLADAKKRAEDDAKKAEEKATLWRNIAIGGGALLGVGVVAGMISFGKKA